MIRIAVSIIVCLAAGMLGSVFTTSSIPTWYATLTKPSFSPPAWIFPPVWTLLYILMGTAAGIIWNRLKENPGAAKALAVFVIQLVLNVLWSFLFFYLKSPLLAFMDIILLWVLILVSIILFYRVSKAASYLMIPYILWVSFATALNLAIYLLNR